MMTKKMQDRDEDFESFAKKLIEEESVALHSDIKGHNQSFNFKNMYPLLEVYAEIMGSPEIIYLPFIFNSLLNV